MRRVVVLAEAADDLEDARKFYEAREAGVGDYCVASLLADIESPELLTWYPRFPAISRGFPESEARWGADPKLSGFLSAGYSARYGRHSK